MPAGGKSEREENRLELASKCEKGGGKDNEEVPPFIEVQETKDKHVSETDPEVLWFTEYILIPLSTCFYQFVKDDSCQLWLHIYGERGGEPCDL